MTQEQKAKAYDEVREKIAIRFGSNVADEIFSRFEMSEDEKIRKEITELVMQPTWKTEKEFHRRKELCAWLEKQGETFTKKDVDNTYLKGVCDAKHELEKQGEIDKESYEIAEKEKREFVGNGFIKCYADFQDFKEGETGWLEYLGNDNYNVRSDNLLGKTYHITPCQLYTIFKKQTWIEKQGEQNPFDYENASIQQKDFAPKVEPKFKTGDWICNNGHSYLIAYIDLEQRRYLFEIGGYTHEQLNWEYIENADSKYHIWTIQDAKDGDVLVYGDNPNDYHVEVIMIFKSLRNKHSAFTHFHIFDDEFRINDWCDCGENAHPATKEQRDALMKAMADAGYTFDFEKKELKKIEHKPAWSEEDEKKFNRTLFYVKNPRQDVLKDTMLVEWLKSLKDRIK